jgi:NitT/TauT family transport system permease protein
LAKEPATAYPSWLPGLLAIGVFIGFLLLWSAAVRFWALPPLVLPGPLQVAEALVAGIADGSLMKHGLVTLTEILLGFLLGSLVGMGLGMLIAQSPLMRRIVEPYLIASQATPKLALAPLFVVWFGFGLTPKVMITALICFFPLLENTTAGLLAAPADELELFRSLGATRRQIFWKLRLPVAMPYLFAGLRVSMVLAVVGAVVAEYVGANAGLGARIIAAQGTMDTPGLFAAFVLLTLLGVGLYQAVVLAERIGLRRWRS